MWPSLWINSLSSSSAGLVINLALLVTQMVSGPCLAILFPVSKPCVSFSNLPPRQSFWIQRSFLHFPPWNAPCSLTAKSQIQSPRVGQEPLMQLPPAYLFSFCYGTADLPRVFCLCSSLWLGWPFQHSPPGAPQLSVTVYPGAPLPTPNPPPPPTHTLRNEVLLSRSCMLLVFITLGSSTEQPL